MKERNVLSSYSMIHHPCRMSPNCQFPLKVGGYFELRSRHFTMSTILWVYNYTLWLPNNILWLHLSREIMCVCACEHSRLCVCQSKYVQNLQQTVSTEMRFTDIEGEDTEDEYTLKGWGNLSPSSISPSLLLPLPLCDDKKSWSPYIDESQLFSLSSRYCICVRLCMWVHLCVWERIPYFCPWMGHTFFSLGEELRSFHAKYRNENEKHYTSYKYSIFPKRDN